MKEQFSKSIDLPESRAHMPTEIINESREFTVDELFFSTTDLKGRIRRANRVFQRIAGYSWDELKGRPHSVIRHPDMPRAIFQLLWNYITTGRPIVAFVKNLANDGRYYWVVALVSPMPNGYVSVRFKATSPLLATVEKLYVEMRAVESGIESQLSDRRAAISASLALLSKHLGEMGFKDYDEFMQSSLKKEILHRESLVRSGSVQSKAMASRYSSAGKGLRAAARLFDELLSVINALFGDLEGYADINAGVRVRSESLTDVSESLRVSALNGVIAVDKVGVGVAGLRPVLESLRSISEKITRQGSKLSSALEELVADVDRIVFRLCAAKLQIEMTTRFAHELLAESGADGDARDGEMTEGAIGMLHGSAAETVASALALLKAIQERTKSLAEAQQTLLSSSRSLRPIYLTGRIQMAAEVGAGIAAVFRDVGEQLEETVANLGGLKNLLQSLDAHLVRGLGHGRYLEDTISQLESEMGVVAGQSV